MLLERNTNEVWDPQTMSASVLNSTRLEIGRRGRQVREILATEGYQSLLDRTRSKLSDWIKPQTYTWPVFPDDVVAADLTQPRSVGVPKIIEDEPIAINWVAGPSNVGQGGYTTISRIINYLQNAGYVNRLYFY